MALSNQIIQMNIGEIISNKNQPRKIFDESSLDTLCKSIQKYGIIYPLIVRKKDSKYEIVSGERRYRAAKKIGLTTVPVIVGDFTDTECIELSLAENHQIKSLNPLEEGKSYKKLLEHSNTTIEDIEKSVGISKEKIQERINLLNLSVEVQKALLKNEISELHAKQLLKVQDQKVQNEILNKIITNKLTVKETNDYINKNIKEKEEVKIMNNNMASALNNLNLNTNQSTVFNDQEKTVGERNNSNTNTSTNMFFRPNIPTQSLENQTVNMNTTGQTMNFNPTPTPEPVNTPSSPMINIPTPSFGAMPNPMGNNFAEPSPISSPTPINVPNAPAQQQNNSTENLDFQMISPNMQTQPQTQNNQQQAIPTNPFIGLTNETPAQPTPNLNTQQEQTPTPINMQPNIPNNNPPQPTFNPMPNLNNDNSFGTPLVTNLNQNENTIPLPNINSQLNAQTTNNNNIIPNNNQQSAPTMSSPMSTTTMTSVELDNAISEIRMAVKNLENRGIKVKLTENDLQTSYQITVEITK